MIKFAIILVIFVSLSACQESGIFWWKNKELTNAASQSRSSKDLSAKIRRLPQQFRNEDEATTTTTTTKKSISIFDRDSSDEEEQNESFKYNDEPDCVCTPTYLCNENNTIITDGSGVINERAFNLCGEGNVCCRIPKSTTMKPVQMKKTTEKPFLTINIPNITSLISTILKPVTSTDFTEAPHQCIAKKGNKLQERILVIEDEEEDENLSAGETKFAEYPWMLELLKKNKATGGFEYKCGAVLINPTTAITANHCLKSKVAGNFLIRAGEWDRSSTLEIVAHQDRPLSRIISHPQYYSGGLFNDIAILKWNHPLNLDINVQPICLPEENQVIQPGYRCTVTAWGKTSQDTASSDILRFVNVPFVERTKCQTQLQNFKLGLRFKLHESFLCFGGEEGLDSCTNDGGSPLVCKRETDDSYYLAGIVSWGLECGKKDIPAAYTNVPHLMKWIKSHI